VIRRLVLALALIASVSAVSHAQLEWDKPSKPKPFANPSPVRVSRDEAAKLVRQVLEEQGFTIKSDAIDQARGVTAITTQPFIFTKGLVADTQFKHFADVRSAAVRKFVRGRVTLKIEVAPVTTSSSTVGIAAIFEGLAEGAIQSEWVTAQSRGLYEDRLLCFAVTRANGDTRNCDENEL
jgi:hypothetical protein